MKGNPMLFTLMIHNCSAKHSSNHIVKLADDTTLPTVRSLHSRQPTTWCVDNNMTLNVEQTKEMIIACSTFCCKLGLPAARFSCLHLKIPPPGQVFKPEELNCSCWDYAHSQKLRNLSTLSPGHAARHSILQLLCSHGLLTKQGLTNSQQRCKLLLKRYSVYSKYNLWSRLVKIV